MMAADTMEALGIARGFFVVGFSSRKLLDGAMDFHSIDMSKRLTILRSLDKFDKLGDKEVRKLLGSGRKDESGDFTEGAGLTENQIDGLMNLMNITLYAQEAKEEEFKNSRHWVWQDASSTKFYKLENEYLIEALRLAYKKIPAVIEAIDELSNMNSIFAAAGYGSAKIRFNPSIVRGLEYYTGPVFECELLMETKDEDGKPVRFGSVGGGGRYDDLVARFTGQQVPATGFSIGVSRLYSALEHLKKNKESKTLAPVVVTVMDKDRQGDYWKIVQNLRAAGIRAEMYIGTSNMQKQMKYADKRGAPLVIIQGGDEKTAGQVTIKDLRLGSELAAGIESREEYASQRLAQVTVAEGELVEAVKKALGL
jgi:histidyl-tRNA synthetase